MKTTGFLSTLACVVLSVGAVAADTAPGCSSYRTEVPLESSVATSKTLANVLRQPESIRAESKRLLNDAESRVDKVSPPEGLCPSYCRAPAQPQIVFSTTPTEFLQKYDQQEKCAELLRATSQTPLIFEPVTFDSIDQFDDWVADFTRGKGPQGRNLYSRCDGKCSPQYLWTISAAGEKLTVETEVTCGHARDKDVSRYKLSSSLRWICDEP